MINNPFLKYKIIEKERFEARALSLLEKDFINTQSYGSKAQPLPLRTPYLFYEEKIKKLIKPDYKVLEVGSGTGSHTYSLIKTGAIVTATDISPNSLNVIKKNLSTVEGGGSRLKTAVADMEQLPFEDGSFDVVVSAGSLSYGDAKKVDYEIRRVLKPNGLFICVDSLNYNPIYKFNRYIHFLRGARSKMTLLNMPTIQRINALNKMYNEVNVKYFGSISFLTPFMKILIGDKMTCHISDFVDTKFNIKYSAFKFVLIAKV